MLKVELTRNWTGIKLSGDYDDFEELVEVIYRLTPHGDDNTHPYFGLENRLLSFCFEVRHAYMGQRGIEVIDNGLNEYNCDFNELKTDNKNVYFSCHILLPETMFLMCALPELIEVMETYYYKNYSYMQYHKDNAYMNMLISLFEEALCDIIGENEFKKIKKTMKHRYYEYMHYATHYVDKCNLEYLKIPLEKRGSKIKSITKRFINKPASYKRMLEDLEYWSKVHECSIYDLYSDNVKYPNTIEW